MFLNVSMSMRPLWLIQLYLNLFQHLSFHNLFHLVHGEAHDFHAQENLIFPALSSATAGVPPNLLKALTVLSDTTVRKAALDQEDLKSYWK